MASAGQAAASFPGQPGVSFVRFNGQNFRIFSMRPDGSRERKVLGPETENAYFAAATSPDGERIVYSRTVGEQFDLFVLRIGGNSKRITNTPNKNEYSPTWTPDGDAVVYMETDEVEYSAIVRRGADGSRRREIDRSIANYLLYPSVSPNGERVLYSRPRGGGGAARGDGSYDLVTKRVDGTGGRRWLTDGARHQIAGDWSPHGKRVVFLQRAAMVLERLDGRARPHVDRRLFRGPPAEAKILSMKVTGGGKRLITDRPGIDGRVQYTPEGERVMFTRFAHDSADLYSARVGGGGLKRLTQTVETYNAFDLLQIVPT